MRRVLSLLLLIVLLVMSIGVVPCFAADEEYKTFVQNDPRWSNVNYGGGTIGHTGCMITSIAVLKAYADPSLRDVNKFNPQVCATQFNFTGGGAIYWGGNDPKWKLVYNSSDESRTEADAIKVIKDKADKGYYILVGSHPDCNGYGPHYSPVVGFGSDGKPVLWDVYFKKNTWSNFIAGISYEGIQIVCYESTVNSSQDTIFNGTIDTKDEDNDSENSENIESIKSELELVGMFSLSDFSAEADYPEFVSNNDLSMEEQFKVRDLRNNQNNLSAVSIVNMSLMVVGVLVLLYSVLLVIAMMFDKVNNLFDFQLVTALTLGRVKLVNTSDVQVDDEARKEGYVSVRSFTVGILIIFIVGILLVSGIITRVLYSFGLW